MSITCRPCRRNLEWCVFSNCWWHEANAALYGKHICPRSSTSTTYSDSLKTFPELQYLHPGNPTVLSNTEPRRRHRSKYGALTPGPYYSPPPEISAGSSIRSELRLLNLVGNGTSKLHSLHFETGTSWHTAVSSVLVVSSAFFKSQASLDCPHNRSSSSKASKSTPSGAPCLPTLSGLSAKSCTYLDLAAPAQRLSAKHLHGSKLAPRARRAMSAYRHCPSPACSPEWSPPLNR